MSLSLSLSLSLSVSFSFHLLVERQEAFGRNRELSCGDESRCDMKIASKLVTIPSLPVVVSFPFSIAQISSRFWEIQLEFTRTIINDENALSSRVSLASTSYAFLHIAWSCQCTFPSNFHAWRNNARFRELNERWICLIKFIKLNLIH